MDVLLPMPGQDLVYAANDHNSTVGVEFEFFRLRPETGALRRLTEGQFLAWSPDGLRFCTAPGRDTTPYEKRKEPYAVKTGASAEEREEDLYRIVWFAPLYVEAAGGGPNAAAHAAPLVRDRGGLAERKVRSCRRCGDCPGWRSCWPSF